MENLLHLFDLENLIRTAGYAGLAAIVFAESGLFFGFFLPGDSLLFAAGFMASQGFLDIWILIPILVIAAILGDSVGYWFGKKVGPVIFTKPDSFWFSHDRIVDAKVFFEKYGGVSIILARFVPFLRTFTPIIAGTAEMRYDRFLAYNIAGGVLWGAGIPILGYYLGALIPDIDKYLLPIIGLLVILSLLPLLGQAKRYWDSRKAGKR